MKYHLTHDQRLKNESYICNSISYTLTIKVNNGDKVKLLS